MKFLPHSLAPLLVPLMAALVLAGCATAPAIDTATLVATPTEPCFLF